MTQAPRLQSALQARDPRQQRAKNLRTGLVLIGTFAVLLVGSIVYAVLNSGAR